MPAAGSSPRSRARCAGASRRARRRTPSPCAARRRSRTRSGPATRRPRRARRGDVALARGQLGLERAQHAEELRLARVDGQLGGARQVLPRGVALVARELELGAAQASRRARRAALRPPRGDPLRSPRPPPSRRCRTPAARSTATARSGGGSVGDFARAVRATASASSCGRPGAARRSGWPPRRRSPAGAPRSAPCRARAQRRRALLDPARRHQRDAERVERADLVDVAAARLLQPRLLGERLGGRRRRVVVARLHHERLARLPREQPGALRARPVVGEQRSPRSSVSRPRPGAASPRASGRAARSSQAARRGAAASSTSASARAASVTERCKSSA